MDGISPMHTTQPVVTVTEDEDEDISEGVAISLLTNFCYSRDKYTDAKIKIDDKIYKVIFNIIFYVNNICY